MRRTGASWAFTYPFLSHFNDPRDPRDPSSTAVQSPRVVDSRQKTSRLRTRDGYTYALIASDAVRYNRYATRRAG
jgi:hypothetical protein